MGTLLDEFDKEFALRQNEPGFDKEVFKTEFIRSRQDKVEQAKAPTRGIIGDIGASIGRAVIGVPQMGLEAIRALDRPGGADPLRGILTPAIEALEDIKPERSREALTGKVREAITSGVESAGISAAPIAIGAGIGSLIPGVGTLVGGIIGAGAGILGFGAAEVDAVRLEGEQHIIDKGLVGEEADEFRKLTNLAAIKAGFVESGGELASDIIFAFTGGLFTPLKGAAKPLIRGSIRALFKQPKLKLAKDFGLALGGESATEFGQAFLQNKFRKDIGLTDTDSLDAAFGVLGATAVTTLLMFGGAKGININHKLRIKKALQDATIDPARRQDAVDKVTEVMAEIDGDRERADVFNAVGTLFVQNDQVIGLDGTPDQLFEQLQVPTQEERVKIEQERAERVGEEPVIPIEGGVEPITEKVEPIVTEELKEKDSDKALDALEENAEVGGKPEEQVIEEVISKKDVSDTELEDSIRTKARNSNILTVFESKLSQSEKEFLGEGNILSFFNQIEIEEKGRPVSETRERLAFFKPRIKLTTDFTIDTPKGSRNVKGAKVLEAFGDFFVYKNKVGNFVVIDKDTGKVVAFDGKLKDAIRKSTEKVLFQGGKRSKSTTEKVIDITTEEGRQGITEKTKGVGAFTEEEKAELLIGGKGEVTEQADEGLVRQLGILERSKLTSEQSTIDKLKAEIKRRGLVIPTEKAKTVVKPAKAKKPTVAKKTIVESKPEIIPVSDAQTELKKLTPQISSLKARIARGIPKKSEKVKVETEFKALRAREAELQEIITPTPPIVAKARKNLKDTFSRGKLGVGVDPTVLKDIAIVGSHHFNRGIKTFLSWSKAMISDLGTSVKRFLSQIWGGISKGQAKQPISTEQFTKEEKEAIIETPDAEVSSAAATRIIAINEVKKESKTLFTPEPDPIAKKFVATNVGRPLNPIQQKVFDQNISPVIIGETPAQKVARSLTDISLKLRTGIVDKYAPLFVIDPKIGKLASVTSNPVGALLTLFQHGPLKLTREKLESGESTFGSFEQKFKEGGKGLDTVINMLGPEMNSLLGWILGNRANKLFALGKEKNLTKKEINEMMKLNEGTMADGRNRPEVYESARKILMELNSNVLDMAQELELVNKEERKTWEEFFYLPFFRDLAEFDAGIKGPKNITGFTGQKAVERLKGSPTAVADMLGNIVNNWSHLLSAAAHNQIGKLTLEKAVNEKFTVDQNIAEKIVAPEYDVRATLDGRFEVTDKALKNKGTFETLQRANEEVESLKDKFIASQTHINKDDLVYIREDGRKIWYRVNVPILYKTLVGLHERPDNSKIMKVMRTFKRMLTFSVTFSPEFKVRNLLKDSIQTIAVSPVSMNIFKNVIEGFRGTRKGSSSNIRIRAGGGEILYGHTMGTAQERTDAMLAKELNIDTVVTTPTGLKKLISLFKKYLQWWNDFGSRLENVNRSAIFEQEINKENGSFLEANFQARDVINFERHGAWPAVKFLIDVVPFLNARIQGLDKIRRGFSDPAQRNQLLAVTGMVALASSLLYLAFKDDEDFQAREDWDRDTYWWFKLPNVETAFRIPKPFEIGVFGTIAERMVEQFVDDKAHGELFRERLMFALTETFNFNIIPQAFSPALELAVNKNFFTDRPIESKSMQNLSPSQRRNAWTSETAIALSSGFDKILWDKVVLSPVQIEHLIQGYLGWIGANILGAVDQVFTQPIGGFPGRPAKRIEEFPIIGSFVRTTPARRTRFETIFYEQLNEVNQTYADIRNYRTIGELDKAINLARKNRDKLRFRKLLNNRQRRLSEINKRIRKIRISRTMSASEKKIKIDRQLEIKNRLLKITVGHIT